MVGLQILSKVINTKDNSIIEDNLLTEDYFPEYRNEYRFIQNHIQTYGNVPDAETFLETFPNFVFADVSESDEYLLDKVLEEHLYAQSVPILQRMADLLQTDSNAAAEYLASQVKLLQPNYKIGGVDIAAQAKERYNKYKEIKENPEKWFFESGFQELDDTIQGIKREEELLVLVARTNQGKSWILEKICTHIWGLGFNVGYFSPEMSADSIGFRLDTLLSHYSNTSLMRGKDDIDEEAYEQYIDNLTKKTNKFVVSTPKDFGNCLTVSKIKQWIVKNKLDLVAIDGITYVSDERGKRNDNKTTSLTNISEDLMSLSVEMKIPVLVVVQANRSGVAQDDNDNAPELESIRDSDGIAHNASTVLSIRQKKDNILVIEIKKKRDGAKGGKLNYTWNINTGEFTFIPSNDDVRSSSETKEKVKSAKNEYSSKDDGDVF